VAAASEKYFENDQPPIDTSTFRCGYLAFNLRSSLKLPFIGWFGSSGRPSTLVAASAGIR
jgi:hypothetical protein